MTQIAAQLSPRDQQVLSLLDAHHYLSTIQLQRFVFTEHATALSAARTCRGVLRRLERDGLVRSLPRRQGGVDGGSAPATWQLAPAGARLVQTDGDRYRTHVPTLRYLHHCLAIAEAHLAIREVSAAAGDTSQVSVEQVAWRRFVGFGGETHWLKPDLHAAIAGRDQDGLYEDAWFVEVDCGSESLPTLVRKCEQYETYHRAGIEQAEGGVFPLVLWVFFGDTANTNRRAASLRRAVARSAHFTPELYRFATEATLPTVLGGQP